MRLPHIEKPGDLAQPFKRANAFWLTAALLVVISLVMFWRRRNR